MITSGEWVCPFCGGEFDGNGDCPNYCGYGFCGICQSDIVVGLFAARHPHPPIEVEAVENYLSRKID